MGRISVKPVFPLSIIFVLHKSSTMPNSYATPIIDREILFGNPVISGGQISPDGRFISFIKPLDGMMNIWIKGIDEAIEHAVPLTEDKTRPVSNYFWSRDSRYVLYVQDKGGNENYHLYKVDPSEAKKGIPKAQNLTDYGDIRAMIYALPKSAPESIYVGINDRDKAWHDCYDINLNTGERTLIYKNDKKLSGFNFDLQGALKLASRATADGGNEILTVTGDTVERILYANLEENINPIKFTKDGHAYFVSNVGDTDLTGLYLYDFSTSQLQLVEADPENAVDLDDATFSKETDALESTIYIGDKKRIYWKDATLEADYNYLKEAFSGAEITITSKTKDQTKFIFFVNDDTDPGTAFLFYRDRKIIEHLYTPRPDLPTQYLAKMQPVRFPSIDGLSIPGYLTLPLREKQNNLPAVLFIHGGPWARDYWGYNSFAQFLANRGYAVLQINFRGSTGYGKKFLNAAINEWGEKMQDDLTAGAQYLFEKGIADKDKIAIAGGSYGGYATLAGLTFTPEVYAAGVSIVGPSNLFTLLDTIPPYWESARVMFHKRMGDPNTEEGRAQLKRQSPFFHAKNIKAPLMVAQGDNDPRVKTSESDQIVIAMRDLGLPVKYINFPDEGHGFANPQNNMSFLVAMEQFLAEHLGGRYQKEVPDNLQEILNKVTVDIDKLTMPAVVTKNMLTAELPTATALLNEGHYVYRLNFDMKGQSMAFDIHREIRDSGTQWIITDKAESTEAGLHDESMVSKETFLPQKRNYQQGPMELSYTAKDHHVTGQASIQGNTQQIDIQSEHSFLMDGPSLDTYLALLPLTENYKTTLRVFDSTNQKFQTYSYKVLGIEAIQSQDCYKCQLQSIDGAEKSQTMWIRKSEAPFMIKKHSIIGEMGGAVMTMEFLRSAALPDKTLA